MRKPLTEIEKEPAKTLMRNLLRIEVLWNVRKVLKVAKDSFDDLEKEEKLYLDSLIYDVDNTIEGHF